MNSDRSVINRQNFPGTDGQRPSQKDPLLAARSARSMEGTRDELLAYHLPGRNGNDA